MAALPHDYHPDIPFTEPPADDDTQPYEWTPPLQEPASTHDDQEQARRVAGWTAYPFPSMDVRALPDLMLYEAFTHGEVELSSAEFEALEARLSKGTAPVTHEPDALMAAVRPLPLLARAAKWAGQTLTAWAEGQAS